MIEVIKYIIGAMGKLTVMYIAAFVPILYLVLFVCMLSSTNFRNKLCDWQPNTRIELVWYWVNTPLRTPACWITEPLKEE